MSNYRDHDYLYVNDDRYFLSPKFTSQQFVNLLHEISFESDFNSLWDIGCGNGALLNYLHTKFPKSNLYGSDIINKSLEVAKKNSVESIKYFLDDITKDNTTGLLSDVIISAGVFQIFEEIEKILYQYISRVKQKGYIFIQGPLNKYSVDVLIKYRDNQNTTTGKIDQVGWNIWSIDYLEKLFSNINEIKEYEFIPVNFPKNLNVESDHKDTIRSWTADLNGENKFMNAIVVQDHFFIKLKIDK